MFYTKNNVCIDHFLGQSRSFLEFKKKIQEDSSLPMQRAKALQTLRSTKNCISRIF